MTPITPAAALMHWWASFLPIAAPQLVTGRTPGAADTWTDLAPISLLHRQSRPPPIDSDLASSTAVARQLEQKPAPTRTVMARTSSCLPDTKESPYA